jgi:hypothetical protein
MSGRKGRQRNHKVSDGAGRVYENQANCAMISRMEGRLKIRRHRILQFFTATSTNSVIRIVMFGCLLSIAICSQIEPVGGADSKNGYARDAGPQNAIVSVISSAGPQCETTGTDAITISCNYKATYAGGAADSSAPRVTLNRAVVSFTPSTESHMLVELTFTNNSGKRVVEQRTVYLAIDDTKRKNYMRRPLPHVDFTELDAGVPLKFDETLLAPAFSPGSYAISLWIPSNNPALKFDPAHNLLLSSEGVPDLETGLNRIGTFTATASRRQKPY